MIKYVISAEHNVHENLTIYDRMNGDTPNGWRINANEGYVMYDPAEERPIAVDPMTGEERQVEIYYFRTRYLPRNYNWSNFTLIAVPEADVI